MMTRRQAIKTTALASAAIAILPGALAQTNTATPAAAPSGPFTLPPLPYAYDALEPHIDAQTMQIRHGKQHAAYVANLNKALAAVPKMGEYSRGEIETLLVIVPNLRKAFPEASDQIYTTVRNQGGGHYNHSLFWQMMKPKGGGEPSGELSMAIDSAFGSFSAFKDDFTKAALGQFGSGWAWLVWDGAVVKIEATPNQDSPLIQPYGSGLRVLLGLDVWEHAYYLKYQNKRADYIAEWWNVVNWDFVSERHAKSITA